MCCREAAHRDRPELPGPGDANGCFMDAKREEPGLGRRSALEEVEGRQRVGTASSPDRSAAVRGASSGQRTRVDGNVGSPFMTGHRAVDTDDPVMTAMRPRP